MKNLSFIILLILSPTTILAQCAGDIITFNGCTYTTVGHRGYSAVYPENTLLAIEEAFKRGVKYTEVDVSLTKDDHYVLFHDESSVYRTTNGSGDISDYTLAELQLLDAGEWKGEQFSGVRIPTLEEALKVAERYGAQLYLDMKDKDFVALKNSIIAAGVSPTRCLPSIANLEEAQELKTILPQTPWVWYQAGNYPPDINDQNYFNQCVQLGCIAFEITETSANDSIFPTFVTNVHTAGAMVWGFTVNDNTIFRDRVAKGFDGLESDRPWEAAKLNCNNIEGLGAFDSLTTGNWIFSGNLKATHVGGQIRPLVYKNPLPTNLPVYASCSVFDIPLVNGVDKVVARVPAFDRNNGLLVHPNFRIENNGIEDGNFTILMDILLPASSMNKWVALFQTSTGNLNDADLFINPSGQIGITESYHGQVIANTWQRIGFTVDINRGSIRKYINGQFVGSTPISGNRWDIWNSSRSGDDQGFLLFSDDDNETAQIFISALQTRNYVLNDAQILMLGGPDAVGIEMGNANAWNVTLNTAYLDSTLLDFEHSTYYFVVPFESADSANLKMELFGGAVSNVGLEERIKVDNGSFCWSVISEDKTQQKTWTACIRRAAPVTGLREEKSLQKQISVYPNPATQLIQVSGLKNDEYKLSIKDLMGRTVLTQTASAIENSVDVSNLTNGCYLLCIETDKEIATQKIIVAH